MCRNEIERVLENWLSQAAGSESRLSDGANVPAWVAERFREWLASVVAQPLADGEAAAERLRAALDALGGWNEPKLSAALEALTHVLDAFGDVRAILGLERKADIDA